MTMEKEANVDVVFFSRFPTGFRYIPGTVVITRFRKKIKTSQQDKKWTRAPGCLGYMSGMTSVIPSYVRMISETMKPSSLQTFQWFDTSIREMPWLMPRKGLDQTSWKTRASNNMPPGATCRWERGICLVQGWVGWSWGVNSLGNKMVGMVHIIYACI